MTALFSSILAILFPLFVQAESTAIPMVDCRMSELACPTCQERVQATCSDQNNIGAFDKNYRPPKVDLKVVNHANGSEKIVSVTNSKFTFADLQSADKLAGLAKQSGLKLDKKSTVEVYQVYVLTTAKFYKDPQGTEVATLGAPGSAARSIASEAAVTKYGGVSRAVQVGNKNKTGKDSK